VSGAVSRTWIVTGMTCEHCVASVTEEVSDLPGVRGVSVELATGRLTLEAAPELTDDEVRAAVEEAGYRLA
jgi:copper chaperone